MVRYLPVSIKQEGLKKYLTRTTNEHDGYGYIAFVKELNKGQSPTSLARMFGVTRNTIYKWTKIHQSEVKKEVHDKSVDELSNV